MEICEDRHYVLVSDHTLLGNHAALIFWGKLTRNIDKRSFGGYTTNIDECEKYALDDLTGQWRFPLAGKDFEHKNWRKQLKKKGTFAIDMDELHLIARPVNGYIIK